MIMINLLSRAISIGKGSRKQQALYTYISKCGQRTASEILEEYPSFVCKKTCVSDFYGEVILDSYSIEELSELYLEGAEYCDTIYGSCGSQNLAVAL